MCAKHESHRLDEADKVDQRDSETSHLVPWSWVVRNVLLPLVGIKLQERMERAIATDDETEWKEIRADIRKVLGDIRCVASLRARPTTSLLVLLTNWRSPTLYMFTPLLFSVPAVVWSSIWRIELTFQNHCRRLATHIPFFSFLALPTLFALCAIACLACGVVVGFYLWTYPFTISLA
ncbi:hypothetical protein BDR07DRAFT_1412288 [Suillus spraguei]|nr:hypothetical protein BDR07DRAFT_1412288 [Suillus spraguei]